MLTYELHKYADDVALTWSSSPSGPSPPCLLRPRPRAASCHSSVLSLCLADLRPLPDVAMTGNCTHECTEFGHSDSCWMPGQPSPTRRVSKSAPKLSTFVPYQEMDGQEQLMANGSPKPLTEERGTGSGAGGSSKVANMRFMTPYSSAYPGGGDSSSKDCGLEEIPLSQAVEYHSATTPTGQTSKREIYL